MTTRAQSVQLSLENITKRYGRTIALDGASLDAAPGTVHALLGENGAGKSTLMSVAFGLQQPDAGTVLINGIATALPSPAAAIAHGISMVHQHFTLVPGLTVAENIALGGHGLFDRAKARRTVQDIGAQTGLALDPDALVESLPVSAQQRLEIVKALAHDARLLILDEPTAVLAPEQITELLRVLRDFADQGGTVILITHKLSEALAIADAVTVLRHGRTVWHGPVVDVTAEALATAMIGHAPADTEDRPAPRLALGDTVITADHLVLHDAGGNTRLHDASFAVRAGELVGIAAVEGSGEHELLLALAGRLTPATGHVTLPKRIGFIPEDRHRDGAVLDMTLRENIALRGAGARRGLMAWEPITDRTARLLQQFDVRADGPGVFLRALSGGNQQKLILARELSDEPTAVVADNPTRGLDIAATASVHDRLRTARARGAAVVVYSNDLDELLDLADRMLVLYAGVVQQVPLERDVIGRAMLGTL